ncbi:MAG: BrnT family toxin [Alphaproteobacteria bacterium]
MEFEWDTVKARKNLAKHGVSFDEAKSVFYDPLAASFPDPDHSWDETRNVIFGISSRNRFLLVSFADRIEKCRIISARTLTKSERRTFEETNQKGS